MNSTEPYQEQPQSSLNINRILSFVTPENLSADVCTVIYDEITKRERFFKLSGIDGNLFVCYFLRETDKYKLCQISVDVDGVYNIVVKCNTNEYTINDASDVVALVDKMIKYMSNLVELHKYLRENYFVSMDAEYDLTKLCIYDNLEGNCIRKIKYTFGCNETNFFMFENDNIKIFNTVTDLDKCEELTKYKNKSKCYYCCCY